MLRAPHRATDGFFATVKRVMDVVDRRQLLRRGAFVWMLYLTTKVTIWTTDFAWQSSRPGLEVAAIIGAIWMPLTALQGALFKFYDQAQRYRNGSESTRGMDE